ncbi:MAG: 50S ribosomal protein L22 [Solirubrobacterales bacterium]
MLEPVFVRATARYVRSSPRKARLVVDHIRNQSVDDARVFLQFTARHVGRDVAKVLESAVANAEHNHELDADNLHIVKAYVDEGPTLKRWRPRAKGRATQILKRTSHITVVVSNASAKELSSKRKAVA